ncbi:MAG: hypothetical protein ABIQ65_21025 [Thermoanaerobaculia bacterium]
MRPDAENELRVFLSKYNPSVRSVAVASRETLRRLLPGAFELVYDNYNALVIAFGATEKTSEVVLSIALYPRWVHLFFANGATLLDPDGLLEGDGKQVRRIRLDTAAVLDRAPVRALIAEAVAASKRPFDPGAANQLVIKSISKKQRPRKPASPA